MINGMLILGDSWFTYVLANGDQLYRTLVANPADTAHFLTMPDVCHICATPDAGQALAAWYNVGAGAHLVIHINGCLWFRTLKLAKLNSQKPLSGTVRSQMRPTKQHQLGPKIPNH